MQFEFIEKEKERIEIEEGDVLICADKNGVEHPLLIISDNGLVSAIDLATSVSEHSGDYLGELHRFIKNTWEIKEIFKKENIMLQLKK